MDFGSAINLLSSFKRFYWIFFLPLTMNIHAQELPLKHFTTENEINPLPGTAITAVTQDREGYIWFYVYGSGLIQYDGHKMELYTPDDGVPNYLFCLVQDSVGRLWAANSNGLVASEKPLDQYLPGERVSFSNNIDSISLNNGSYTIPNELYVDREGNVWTRTAEDIILYHYDDSKLLQVDSISLADLPEKQRELYGFFQRNNGDVCAITKNENLLVIDPDKNSLTWNKLQHDFLLDVSFNKTVCLFEDDKNALWGARDDGILWKLIEGDSLFHTEFIEPLKDVRFNYVINTKQGYLLASSLNYGLLKLNPDKPGELSNISLKNGLLSNAVWDVMEDAEGNIWIASNSGLSRMPGDFQAFGHYTGESLEGRPAMLPESGVSDVISGYKWDMHDNKPKQKILVVGTASGLSFISEDHNSEIIQMTDGLLDDLILGLNIDGAGRLWIMGRQGISCISQDKALMDLPGLGNMKEIEVFGGPAYVASLPWLHIGYGTNIWLKKSDNGTEKIESTWFLGAQSVMVLVDKKWYFIGLASGLAPKDLNTLSPDDRGYIYLGGEDEGIYQSNFPITLERLESFKTKESDKPRYRNFFTVLDTVFSKQMLYNGADTISGLTSMVWKDSLMWASSELGVLAFRVHPLEVKLQLKVEQGLPQLGIAGIISDPKSSSLWAASAKGMILIDSEKGKVLNVIGQKDGLVSDICWGHPSLDISDEGILYYATPKGLSIYNPKYDKQDTSAPRLDFRKFKLTEKPGIANELQIEYAALSYTNEAGIRYKTRLNGLENEWSDETAETSLRFTNLPAFVFPKTYSFEVIAGDEKGNWTDKSLSYEFKVKPPWFVSWWMVLVYIVAGLITIIVYGRLRTAKLKQRQKVLEHTVKVRTAEVVAQKDVILKEKERSEELLLNILPYETAEELKEYGSTKAKNFETVTVLFTDFKGFTQVAEQLDPQELVAEIDHCFKAFDRIVGQFKVEKIKTIGDSYMAAAGLPTPNKSNPSDAVAAGLAMRDFMLNYKKDRDAQNLPSFEMRIGIHTGPIVAGIVGIKKFSYDIWGDTVNTASRMESSGEIGKVNISQNTFEHIEDSSEFTFEHRGKIEAKHKGELKMYFVEWKNKGIL